MKQKLLFIKTLAFGLLFTGLLLSHNVQSQTTTWTGTLSDTDWFDAGNWDAGVPVAGTNAVIPSAKVVVISTDFWAPGEVNNLLLDGVLIINPSGYLTVSGTLTNNGTMLMLTDETYNASLICSSFAGTGGFKYDRYLGITTPNDPEYGWHYISSPVSGFSSYNIYDYFVNTWDEPTSLWEHHSGAEPCVPAAEIFNDGVDGWSVMLDEGYDCPPNPPTGQTISFEGTPNFGNQTKTITASGVGTFPNFNLVGNPYPSYWNYDDFFFGPNFPAAGIFDAIYFWDESINNYASYVNGISSNGGSDDVPPAQAFFLESISGGELLFTDDERTHVSNIPFWKDAETDLVRLQASANGFTDEAIIRFNENSTINRDKNDARKLISPGTGVPALYTKAGDINLSINGLPATDIVPVYFKCNTAGTYTIDATETSEFTHLVLEDMVTGEKTDLLKDSHSFDYASTNEAHDFKLLYASVGIEDMEASNIKIWSGTGNVYVEVPETTNGDIAIYNVLGQEMLRTAIVSGSVNTIPMEASNSYYIVKVLTGNNAITGKVFIK